MRTLLCVALAGLVACGESPIIVMPLGQLVAVAPPTKPVAVQALLLPPGESIWDVRAGGMTIGRAELHIGETEIHSQFKTSSIASMFAAVHHDLVTTLDRPNARPQAAIETVKEGGETSHSEVAFDGSGYTLDGGEHMAVPDGKGVHTIHSALGWIRAWASPEAATSSIYVLEDRDLYRIDLERPQHEDLRGSDTLRIDGHIHTADHSDIAISMWLTADSDRKPVRLSITAAKIHITAELVS